MFEMVKSSAILFFQGKLFQNQTEVYRQLAIGIGVTLVIFLVVAKLSCLPLAGLVAGFVGGAIQPYLFRDLKFR
jgi:uncharacterized membrane protein